MTVPALIGIDIGTTAVKAVLADLTGTRLDSFARGYETLRPGPGLVEQDPADWMALVNAALAQFAAHRTQVQAIGITSQVNTHVFCDANLQPLCPAIVWQDGRATKTGAALDSRLTTDAKIKALGAPIPIDGSHALARMGWMAVKHPDIWARTSHVLLPKDYVIAQLTGGISADPIAAVGLVGTDLRYAAAVTDLLDGAASRLPVLADPLEIAGLVRSGPFAGVSVITGTMDAWAAMFGTGMAQDGQAMNLSGTSEVLGLISAIRNPVPGVITFPAWRGITLHAAPTQAGGASLDWLGRVMGQDAAALASLAPGGWISATTPLFLPHLAGERAPLWDIQARGVFAGLSGAASAQDLVLSVMEGVACSARLALESLDMAGGVVAAEVRLGGGGTVSDIWCQIRADTLGRDMVRMQAQDAGAVGAMVMAGVGAGVMSDLATAASALVPVDRRFCPDPVMRGLADRRFAIWKDLYQQVRPINAALHDLAVS